MLLLLVLRLIDNTDKTQINKVVYHAPSKLCYTAHEDGDLRVFDTVTGDIVLRTEAHPGGVSSLSISGDGKTIVTTGT